MTRELKLSLIVGFSLVLVVTVLVSDYLSKARSSRLDGSSPVAPVASSLPVTPTAEMLESAADRKGPSPSVRPSPGGGNASGTKVASERGNGINVPRGNEPDVTPVRDTLGGRANPDIDRADADRAANDSERIAFEPVEIRNGGFDSNDDGASGVGAGATPESMRDSGTPGEKSHTVAEGESFYALAKRFYRDGSLAKQLAMYNRIDPKALKSGAKIKIPTVEVLTGKVSKPMPPAPRLASNADAPSSEGGRDAGSGQDSKFAMSDTGAVQPLISTTPRNGGSKPDARQQDAKPPAKPETKPETKAKSASYTVKKGDTLDAIAKRVLGKASRSGEIMRLNSSILDDEFSLREGMVLRLPAK